MTPFIDPGNPLFSRNFNREPFSFTHRIPADPLFTVDGILALSKRLPNDMEHVYYSYGDVRIDQQWASQPKVYSLQETIARIHESNSLVLLKKVDEDPEYRDFFQRGMAEIVEYVGDRLKRDLVLGEIIVFVTSPNRITPFHIDAELNYLFQIQGSKTIRIYDPADKTVLTDPEIERYHRGNHGSATYRPENDPKAKEFRLVPGRAVHVPVHAPHWVGNDGNVSVSMSINFELKSVHQASRVYVFNHFLRRTGLSPTPPGRSRAKDLVKSSAIRLVNGIRRSVKGKDAKKGS